MSERMDWSDEMVETLLDLRVKKFHAYFSGSKSKAQLAAAWIGVNARFMQAQKTTCTVDQLHKSDQNKSDQNKFFALKRQFDTIRASESLTGNATETPIAYPSYWATLVDCFGDLTGMGNRDYGQTGLTTGDSVASDSAASDSAVSTPAASGPAAAGTTSAVPSTIQKRASRKRKADLADAVAKMAAALTKRLEHDDRGEDGGAAFNAVMARVEAMESKVTTAMEGQDLMLESLHESLKEATKVNKAILAYIQSTTSAPTATEPGAQTTHLG